LLSLNQEAVMKLNGFHHLTAITADAARNHHFYTHVMGLRLVKKTVNQDDTRAYHLFYADGEGSPGTDITFFDWPAAREVRGTHSVCRTGFRVSDAAAIAYWSKRLHDMKVEASDAREENGRLTLNFEDFEGQRLAFVVDESGTGFKLWSQSDVPEEYQVRGLGPITLSVPDLAPTEMVLTRAMGMEKISENDDIHVYKMNAQGPVAELQVKVEPELHPATQGAGGVHHVAFNIAERDYAEWANHLKVMRIPNSGPIDRYWFKSLYFREPNGILFEIATDGPGFQADEPMDRLGETLSLPPFLEAKRSAIEAGLKPLAQ
jgi:glyoxalase family protein